MDEAQAVNREPVEVVPAPSIEVLPPAGKDPKTGQFLPGHRLAGSRRGSLNRVTKIFREELVERVQRTGENPLLILLDIASTSPKDEVRVRACDVLLGYIMPRKLELGMDTCEEVDEERISRVRRVFASMFIEEVTEVR